MKLITGATGFIGCRMAKKFHAMGDKLVLMGRIKSEAEQRRAKRLQALGLQVRDIDINEPGLASLTKNVDVVIHLAAAQHEAGKPESYFKEVNVDGTRNLLNAAVASNVRRFVYASTIGVFGDVSGQLIDDNYKTAPDNCYGRTKLEAERVVTGYADRLEVTVARVSETYGPGDLRLLKLFSGVQKGHFFIIGDGTNCHQLLYVDDLISAIREMTSADSVLNEKIVLSGDEVLTTREMCEYVASAVGFPLHRLQLPLWPFIVAGFMCEQTFGRVGINPPLHRRRLDFFRKSLTFSSSNRNRLLEWRPRVTFAQGSDRTTTWYRDHALLPAIEHGFRLTH